MTDLTDLQKAWLAARETIEAEIALMTIYHPMIETFYLARNVEDVTSRGIVFVASYFEPTIITDSPRQARAQVTIPNVNGIGRKIALELKKLVNPPYITLEIINAADPNVLIYRAARLKLQDVSIDPISITGNLVRQDHSTETLGKIRIVPSKFPALFRRI